MADTEINVGASWKSIDNCEVNVGSSWKQVETIEINVGGTWYTVWQNKSVTLPADSGVFDNSSGSDNPTYAGVSFNTDGTYDSYNASGSLTERGTWFTGYTPGTELWIKCTVTGDTVAGGSDTTGSFLQCSANRKWFYADSNSSAASVENGTWTIEVSTDASGTPVVDSTTLTPSANYDTS